MGRYEGDAGEIQGRYRADQAEPEEGWSVCGARRRKCQVPA